MEFRKIALPAAIAAALLTSACGGGGSSTAPHIDPVTPNTKTLSGMVAKGMVRNGAVSVLELVGGSWTERGTGRTDASGQYNIPLSNYQGGALKVLAKADDATRMKCDAEKCGDTAFGKEIALSNSFVMETIIPAFVATPVPVSPYTNVLAARLEALNASSKGGVTKAQIESAAATFSQFTGFPVLTTPVVDLTDSKLFAAAEDKQKLAALLGAAIIKMAATNKQDLATALSNLAKAYEDGSFDGDGATIKSLLDAWGTLSSDVELNKLLTANSAALGLLKTQVQAITELCTKNKCTLDPQQQDKADLEKAKSLARNSYSFIDKLINTNFEDPLNKLGKNLSDAFFDRNATGITQVMGASLEGVVTAMVDDKEFKDELFAMRDAINTDKNSTQSVTRNIEIKDDGELLGTLTVVADYSKATSTSSARYFQMGVKGALSGTNTDGRTVNVDLALKGDFDLLALIGTDISDRTLKMAVTGSVKDAITALNIMGGSFQARVNGPVDANSSASVLSSLSLNDLTMTLKGPKGDFSGQGGFKLVSNADALLSSYLYEGKPKLSLAQITLNGGLTTTDGKSIKAKSTLDVSNADKLDLLAFLNSEEVIDFSQSSALTDAQALAVRKVSSVAQATGTWSLGYAIDTAGVMTTSFKDGANDTQKDLDAYSVLAAQFEPVAQIKAQLQSFPNADVKDARVFIKGKGDTITSSTLKGKVDLGSYETDSNFLQAELTASFDFTGVEGLPSQMNAWIKRDKLNGGSANIQATWNGEWYNYALQDADVKKNLGSLTVTDVYGTKLLLDKISYDDRISSGVIYVGTKKMAEVTTNKGVVDVTYSDGSSERLQ